MPFTLAIVGRPNTGKSTLFNRLVGRRLALVDDQPGVTRDLREGRARLGPLRFVVLDTAGFEEATGDSLPARMRRLTERAVDAADACLFLVDARTGLLPADRSFADLLRRRGAHVLLAANKAEGRAGAAGLLEATELGFGEPLALSAEHGEGMGDLAAVLAPLIGAAVEDDPLLEAEPETDVPLTGDVAPGDAGPRTPTVDRPLQIAVVGRPNAGKSTLVNAILGEDRLLTGPEAGITRDAISVARDWLGTPVRIFDTAGMRRRAKVQEKLEKLSVADGLRAVRFAEVVVVAIDALIPLEKQDLKIADLAEREGRAVVLAITKWDLIADRPIARKRLQAAVDTLLPQLRGVPMITVSGVTGQGLDRLHAAVVAAYAVWNARVPTARLNRWLAAMVAAHPPPAPGGRRIRLRYITQARTRPPGFVVMCSNPGDLPEAYDRYLINGLRADFDLPGTPIRLFQRSQAEANPYRNRKKKTPSRLTKHLRK
jgi:GTP-binding protein